MKHISILFYICLFASIGISAQTADDKSLLVGIDNMHKVDDGVYRSGQPDKEDFIKLEKAGITEVLNLRRYHSDDDEAEGTSIKLHRIKTRAEAVSEEQLLEAMRIIKNRKGDILIHCWHGSDRTGIVVAMYRIVFQEWTKEAAIDEMINGGYGYHKIYGNLPDLINKIDIEEFKKKVNSETDTSTK